MLRRFTVANFKGFEKEISLDFGAREYSFNGELIKNGIVNKALIYGKNGVGKSSLGIAIFDLITHLTDKQPFPQSYLISYRNLNHVNDPVTFKYEFKFGDDEITYIYHKYDAETLIDEKLIFNDKTVLDYSYTESGQHYIAEELSCNLNINLTDNKLSIIKYIYRNVPTNTIPLLTKMMAFCENMLWYRSLSDGNAYAGFTNGGSVLTARIYEKDKLSEFESFLRTMGVEYKLRFETVNGTHELYAIYDGGNSKALFTSIASTGTMALTLYFVWSITAFDKISFLFIDEFDAFLHYEASEAIVSALNHLRGFQSVLTTHNTSLMNNKITRPDCCYIMTSEKITSFANATERELREGHNLEKLYKSGEFDG